MNNAISAADALALALAWTAAAQGDAKFRDRAMRAVSLVSGVEPVGHNAFTVTGSSDAYTVTVDRDAHTSACTCGDYVHRAAKCKHILAAGMFDILSRKGRKAA